MDYTSVIFKLNTNAGFYSILFYMCRAILLAKRLGIPFYIEDSTWIYRYKLGWHDYFQTLQNIENPDHMKNPCIVWQGNCPFEDYTIREYVAISNDIYHLRSELVDRVETLRKHLGPSYVAVFVRRGCKMYEEAPYIPVEDIYAKMNVSRDTVLFVQTDDYTVVEEFRGVHPAEKVIATVPISKRGQYHNREYLVRDTINKYKSLVVPLSEQPRQQVREETEEMLVGLEVCRKAPVCWTDCKSNVGRFLKLTGNNVHYYPVDGYYDMNSVGCPAHEIPFISDSLSQGNGH